MPNFYAPPPAEGVTGGYRFNEQIAAHWPDDASPLSYRFCSAAELFDIEPAAGPAPRGARQSQGGEKPLVVEPPGRVEPVVLDSLLFDALSLPAIRRISERAPLAMVYHHMPSLDPLTSRGERLRRVSEEIRKLSHCSHIIAPSRYVARTIRRRFSRRHLRAPRITVVYPAVDTLPGFAQVPTSDRGARREPGACGTSNAAARHRSDVPNILTVANFDRRKDQIRLLNALATIDDYEWSWNIVGSGSHAPDYYHAFLRRLENHRLRNHVVLHGTVSHARIHKLFREADIFALTSRFETYGMVYAEAAAAGLPSVALRAGGVSEVLEGSRLNRAHKYPYTSRTALLLRHDAGERTIARAIASLLRDPRRRRSLGTAAKLRARDYPNWSTQASKFADAIESTVRTATAEPPE